MLILLQQLFYQCSSLEQVDVSKLDFTLVTNFSNMLTNVPTDCLILVKDQTAVDWFTTNWPDLTNVQIKS